MQYYSMDTQNVKSGQNGQTDVQDDNRVIVKIRDLPEKRPSTLYLSFSFRSLIFTMILLSSCTSVCPFCPLFIFCVSIL